MAKILHNRIYTGDFDFDGKTYRGRYEPIVTRELWQRVQQVLQGRHGRQKRRHDFAFSGLIACGKCGRAMVGERKKGRYVYCLEAGPLRTLPGGLPEQHPHAGG